MHTYTVKHTHILWCYEIHVSFAAQVLSYDGMNACNLHTWVLHFHRNVCASVCVRVCARTCERACAHVCIYVCVCGWNEPSCMHNVGLSTYQFILYYAHVYTHTAILIPFEDGEPTGLKVDICLSFIITIKYLVSGLTWSELHHPAAVFTWPWIVLCCAGQDTLSCGLVAVMYAGVICASQVLGRNLMNDLTKLRASINAGKSVKQYA